MGTEVRACRAIGIKGGEVDEGSPGSIEAAVAAGTSTGGTRYAGTGVSAAEEEEEEEEEEVEVASDMRGEEEYIPGPDPVDDDVDESPESEAIG